MRCLPSSPRGFGLLASVFASALPVLGLSPSGAAPTAPTSSRFSLFIFFGGFSLDGPNCMSWLLLSWALKSLLSAFMTFSLTFMVDNSASFATISLSCSRSRLRSASATMSASFDTSLSGCLASFAQADCISCISLFIPVFAEMQRSWSRPASRTCFDLIFDDGNGMKGKEIVVQAIFRGPEDLHIPGASFIPCPEFLRSGHAASSDLSAIRSGHSSASGTPMRSEIAFSTRLERLRPNDTELIVDGESERLDAKSENEEPAKSSKYLILACFSRSI